MFDKLIRRFLKAKNIEDTIPIFLILLMSIPIRVTSAEELLLSSCRLEDQNAILNLNQNCKLREQVEDIWPHLKDFEDDIHRIIPPVVVLKRCGGEFV
jgi:hypothetical protein